MNEFSLSSLTPGLRVLGSHHACVALYRPAGLLPQTRESEGGGSGTFFRPMPTRPTLFTRSSWSVSRMAHFVTLSPLLKYGIAVLIAVPCCFTASRTCAHDPFRKANFLKAQ